MSNPFVGEIRMFAGNFAPSGWAFCDGQLLSIAENDVLFALIGTTYGGDGQTTFALPDLRGRIPIHFNASHPQGESSGAETVTLLSAQMPVHAHPLQATSVTADRRGAKGALFAVTEDPLYAVPSGGGTSNLDGAAVSPAGSNQPHDNLQPFLCVHFIISLFGIFPSQA
jgi:microcystin-dependent protein